MLKATELVFLNATVVFSRHSDDVNRGMVRKQHELLEAVVELVEQKLVVEHRLLALQRLE